MAADGTTPLPTPSAADSPAAALRTALGSPSASAGDGDDGARSLIARRRFDFRELLANDPDSQLADYRKLESLLTKASLFSWTENNALSERAALHFGGTLHPATALSWAPSPELDTLNMRPRTLMQVGCKAAYSRLAFATLKYSRTQYGCDSPCHRRPPTCPAPPTVFSSPDSRG